MGDLNQLFFVKKNASIVSGPILEIGSRDYGTTPNFRLLFPNSDYIGIDLEDGKGVDIILDFTNDIEIIDEKLGKKRFNTIFCFSVLEHCKDPFKMCDNISKLLNKNGFVFISVPFSWAIHAYPDDYWRFTPSGIRILFPNFDFKNPANKLSTSEIGEIKSITTDMFQINLLSGKNKYIFYFLRKLKLFNSLLKFRAVFPPVMVNMIGKKT